MSRPAVVVFVLVALEFVALTQLADAIGGLQAVLVLIGLSVVGVALFRRIAASLIEGSVSTAMQNAGIDNAAGMPRPNTTVTGEPRTSDRAMMLFGALLMIIPGVVTGVLGLLFLLPPVRAIARPIVLQRIQPWIRPNLRFGRGTMGFGRDVVDVDLVDDTNDEPPSPRPELS